MALTLDRFCVARARVLKTRQRLDSVKHPLEAKYGGASRLYQANKGETRKLEAAERAAERASDRFFALLDASPRDWRHGVPSHWVLLHLSFADAARPLSEPLAVEPPCSFGSAEVKR